MGFIAPPAEFIIVIVVVVFADTKESGAIPVPVILAPTFTKSVFVPSPILVIVLCGILIIVSSDVAVAVVAYRTVIV